MASAGIGNDEYPPSIGIDELHSVGGVDAGPASAACSTIRRITAPLAAHGVGTDRRTTAAAGMRASISESVSWARAISPAMRTKAAVPSSAGANSGHDEAAPSVCGKRDLRAARPPA